MSATIYDTHENFQYYPWPFVEAYCAWLREHGIDNSATYRTEHHLIDAPLVRVFQVEFDENHFLRWDPETQEVARRKPFDVLIKTSPPKPEDYA